MIQKHIDHFSSMKFLIRSGTILFIFFALISCAKEDLKTMIQAKWEISSAEREGKMTNSLEGLYFDFVSDSQFRSNILGEESVFEYSLNDRTIDVDHALIKVFDVISITDSMLTLNTTIREESFTFNMKK
jgi:hypothetical protein